MYPASYTRELMSECSPAAFSRFMAFHNYTDGLGCAWHTVTIIIKGIYSGITRLYYVGQFNPLVLVMGGSRPARLVIEAKLPALCELVHIQLHRYTSLVIT